eukprot:2980756-Pyramimonas_sp.AAC.1
MSAQSNESEGGSLAGSSARASINKDFRRPVEPHVPTWIQISGFCKDGLRKIENRDKAKLPVSTARNIIAKLCATSSARDGVEGNIFDKERTERDLDSDKFGATRSRIYYKNGTPKDTVWK